MKTAILLVLIFISSVSYSQSIGTVGTTISAGEGNFFSYKSGETAQFKLALISQINQTFGKFTVSALTVGVADSVARGYIGTGIAYEVSQIDSSQSIYAGVNVLKGEGKDALMGASLSYRINGTLISAVYERDITFAKNWVGLTVQQIILGF